MRNLKVSLVMIAALLAALVPVSVMPVLAAGVIDVSLSTQLTSGGNYDRNPSFLHAADGTYWLFFTRTTGACDPSQGCNPDAQQYNVFYMTSADGATWSTPAPLSDRTGITGTFYGRTVAATQDASGTIWAFWASGGNSASVYYYTYSGGVWSARQEMSDQPYFNVEAVATPDGKVWMFYEDEGSTAPGIYVKSYDGTAWSAPSLVAADRYIPKVTVSGGTFSVAMVDGSGTDYVVQGDGTTWGAPSIVAAPGGGVTNWDPTIYQEPDGKLNVFFAPDLGTGAQRIAWTQSADGSSWPGTSTTVTAGGYGTATWWDYWPEAGTIGGDTYLFYTSEKKDMVKGTGHIWVTKVDWSAANDHYEAILPAVDAAQSDDTVMVAAGHYPESQILIDQGLTLQGAGAATTTIDGGNAAATAAGTLLIRNNAGAVLIDGFSFENPIHDSYGDYMSINASPATSPVTIQHNHFIGLGLTDNPGDVGVYAVPGPAADVVLQDNEFDSMWQAVQVETPQANVTVANNDFHHLAATTLGTSTLYEPEAIFIHTHSAIDASGATVVDGNHFSDYSGLSIAVSGGYYPGVGTGQFTDVQIINNSIDAVGAGPERYHVGIVLRNPGTNATEVAADGVHHAVISGNMINGSDTGNNSKGIWLLGENSDISIAGNTIHGLNQGIGVEASTAQIGTTTGLTVARNEIGGNATGIALDASTGSDAAIHLNAIAGNAVDGLNNGSASTLDATCNYWGNALGPTTAGNPKGRGDRITGSALFSPWLRADNQGQAVSCFKATK